MSFTFFMRPPLCRTIRISCRGRLQDLHAARNQNGGPGQLHPLVMPTPVILTFDFSSGRVAWAPRLSRVVVPTWDHASPNHETCLTREHGQSCRNCRDGGRSNNNRS